MLDVVHWAVVVLTALGVLAFLYLTALKSNGRGEGGDDFIDLGG